jgi:WD40 repeat protein
MSLAHQDRVLTVAFTPDCNFVATGSADKTARLWETASGNQIFSLQHPNVVQSVAISRNGLMLATGCHDGFARLWDVGTGKLICPPLPLRGSSSSASLSVGRIWTVNFSTDSTQFFFAGQNNAAYLWPIPVPNRESVHDILLRLQVITGMELDPAGAARELSLESWREKRKRVTLYD